MPLSLISTSMMVALAAIVACFAVLVVVVVLALLRRATVSWARARFAQAGLQFRDTDCTVCLWPTRASPVFLRRLALAKHPSVPECSARFTGGLVACRLHVQGLFPMLAASA
jgi:hypothetical protein